MAESKSGEGKVSSKMMEAAMVARLFKDSMESDAPIVGHFVWERDDGQSLELVGPHPHPSFPSADVACRRLEQRISQWVSGDKAPLDKNAILRLSIPGNAPFDLSMESFEKAALAEDGVLLIGVGQARDVERSPMDLSRVIRLKLFGPQGALIGRKQALLPIKELIGIQKREREAQARRLENHQQSFEEEFDVGHINAREEAQSWAEQDREPVKAPEERRSEAPARTARAPSPLDASRQMLDVALAEVSKNMSASLKSAPLPVAEAVLSRKAPSQPDPAWMAAEGASERDGLGGRESLEPVQTAPNPVQAPRDAAPPAVAPVAAASRGAVPSQVKTEAPAAKIEPEFVRAVFPPLPEGTDEIHLTIERDDLFDALDALEDYGSFEIRLALKGAGHFHFGLCLPAGQVAMVSDFVAKFSRGGVMIKRSPGRAA